MADIIRREGPIPFSRYMALCLYHPEHGYYMRAAERFGKAGDFYTSSDVHAVFGRLLCRQFEELWRSMGSPSRVDLVEFGPGRGFFASDVLHWAHHRFPAFAAALRYCAVETSPDSRARLSERLAEYSAQVSIRSSLDDSQIGENLIVFGNEFFDAFPVEIVTSEGMVVVDVGSDDRFVEKTAAAPAAVIDYLDHYSVHPSPGQRVEATLEGLEAMRRIAALFASRKGFCVFVDYGYTRAEQLAGRHLDTLMTYQKHKATSDSYAAPGEQDLTTHVNFTALQSEAERQGLRSEGLVTQSSFLLGIGEQTQFADAFDECKFPQERAKRAMQLKHLIAPERMGETFQVLVLSRGVSPTRISGLSFGK